MNTAVIIEPRKIDKTASVIHNFQSILSKNEWNFVFYCGKDLKQYWEDKVSDIEIRELDVDNLRPSQYNDLLKRLTDDDWKDIRKKMEEKLPETKNWPEDMFRQYSSAVVRSGFRKEGLN